MNDFVCFLFHDIKRIEQVKQKDLDIGDCDHSLVTIPLDTGRKCRLH